MNRKALAQEIYTTSHIEGNFTLRSGQTSREYFDKYLFESNPKLLFTIANLLLKNLPPDTEIVAGLEMGGIPIATTMAIKAGLPVVFVRKHAKEYGTCKLVEGTDIRDKKVCIIEDVVTTGGQIILSVNEMRKLGAKIENVMCVILRDPKSDEYLGREGLKLTPFVYNGRIKDGGGEVNY